MPLIFDLGGIIKIKSSFVSHILRGKINEQASTGTIKMYLHILSRMFVHFMLKTPVLGWGKMSITLINSAVYWF